MTKSHAWVAAIAAAALIGLSTGASAAPAGGMVGAGDALRQEASTDVEQAGYSCWWRHGRKYCAWTRPAPRAFYGFYAPRRHYFGYGYGYGYGRRYGW